MLLSRCIALSDLRVDKMLKRRSVYPLAIASLLALAAAAIPARAQQTFSDDQMADANIAAGNALDGWTIDALLQAPPSNVEVLADTQGKGWRVADLKFANGKFTQEWISPPLNLRYIDVGSKDDSTLVTTKDFVGVTFSGCPAHLCDSYIGIYLHVIGQRQGFEMDVADKQISYSPNLSDPKNKIYLAWMKDQVNSLPWIATSKSH
jgi:hypothetical protein